MANFSQNQKHKDIFGENMTASGVSRPIFVADFKTVDFTIVTGLIINYINLTDAFVVGEPVTGGTSGSTAVVVEDDGVGVLILSSPSAAFTNGETITGGTSGATAEVATSATPEYEIDCLISNNELVPADPTLPSTPENQWSDVSFNDLSDGSTYDSTNVYDPANVQASKTFEANIDGARWFYVRIATYTSGVLLRSDADLFSNFT